MSSGHDRLSEQFEATRPHLRAVAYRMLGSAAEADDALQEAWLKVSRADTDAVRNLGGWLTTLVARVCLDMLRARRRRREEPISAPELRVLDPRDPEGEALLADSVGQALLVVLDALSPPERLAFVLHDLFDLPYSEIGEILGRSPEASRQLASRARRRVRGGTAPSADLRRRQEVVDAFLAASRAGDFESLLRLLDPDAVLRADAAAARLGAAPLLRGARGVAQTFAGRARAAQPALLGGEPGLIWRHRGRPRIAFRFSFQGERIREVALVGDPVELDRLTAAPAP